MKYYLYYRYNHPFTRYELLMSVRVRANLFYDDEVHHVPSDVLVCILAANVTNSDRLSESLKWTLDIQERMKFQDKTK